MLRPTHLAGRWRYGGAIMVRNFVIRRAYFVVCFGHNTRRNKKENAMSNDKRPSISTHVLDTERGLPAQGVPVMLSRWEGSRLVRLTEAETDDDGRVRELLDGVVQVGSYQISFKVDEYFREQGGDVPFLSRVTLDFEVTDAARHYHVPLLLSRFSCTSYRGS